MGSVKSLLNRSCKTVRGILFSFKGRSADPLQHNRTGLQRNRTYVGGSAVPLTIIKRL